MKKSGIAAVIAACLMAAGSNAVLAENSISTVYDASNNAFKFEGVESKQGFFNVVMTSDKNLVGDAVFGDENFIARTFLGNANAVIELPDSTDGTRLYYTLSGDATEKRGIIQSITASKLQSIAAEANSADKAAMVELVKRAVPNVDNSKVNAIARTLVSSKPDGGYTPESFMDTYMLAEAREMLKANDSTFAEAVETYALYFEPEVHQFISELDDEVKEGMGKSFAEGKGDINAALEESKFYVNCRVAKSNDELKDLILAYADENGIKTTTYDSITNNYYKEKVITTLFAAREDFTNVQDIMDKFEKESETRLAESKKASSNSGGSGSGGSSGGSGSSGGGNMAPPYLDPNIKPAPTPTPIPVINNNQNKPMADVKGHWAEKNVIEANVLGIVKGFEDGSFRPDDSVTRAQFVTMIMNIVGVNNEADCSFNDVSADAWYYKNVASASTAGYIAGFEGNFMPDKNITREDAAVILSKVLADKGVELNADAEYAFEDVSDVSDYAVKAIGMLADKGVVSGDNGQYKPKGLTTRAEAAVLLLNVSKLF